jgi:hypothetical protein
VLLRYATYARTAPAAEAASPGTGPDKALIEPTWISEPVTPGASDGAEHGAGPPPPEEASGPAPSALPPDAADPPVAGAPDAPTVDGPAPAPELVLAEALPPAAGAPPADAPAAWRASTDARWSSVQRAPHPTLGTISTAPTRTGTSRRIDLDVCSTSPPESHGLLSTVMHGRDFVDDCPLERTMSYKESGGDAPES